MDAITITTETGRYRADDTKEKEYFIVSSPSGEEYPAEDINEAFLIADTLSIRGSIPVEIHP